MMAGEVGDEADAAGDCTGSVLAMPAAGSAKWKPPFLPDASRPSLRTLHAQQVRQAHRDAGGNVTETARCLGASRNTVYRALRGSAR
ncbi:MAG TPA: helix-turn-helix domain-containing protein [Acetobacteraceae bacterium]